MAIPRLVPLYLVLASESSWEKSSKSFFWNNTLRFQKIIFLWIFAGNFFQFMNDNGFLFPECVHSGWHEADRDILQVIDFRFYTGSTPFISIAERKMFLCGPFNKDRTGLHRCSSRWISGDLEWYRRALLCSLQDPCGKSDEEYHPCCAVSFYNQVPPPS